MEATEARLNEDVLTFTIAAASRRSGRLVNTASADDVARRLRDHADRMIEPSDAALLVKTAALFERLSTKTKAQTGGGMRAKAGGRPPMPSMAELLRAQDAAQVFRGGAFDRTSSEDLEECRADVANKVSDVANKVLREKNRKEQAERVRRFGQPEPQRPWWR